MTQAVSSEPHGLAALDWTFADRIRKVRRDVLAIDQGEFATRLGVTRQAYAAWESGRNEPRSILAVAKRIEAMSGVPAAWVLGLDITQANSREEINMDGRLTIGQAALVLGALRQRKRQHAEVIDIESVAWWAEELALAEVRTRVWRDVELPPGGRAGAALVQVCIEAYPDAEDDAVSRVREAQQELRRLARSRIRQAVVDPAGRAA